MSLLLEPVPRATPREDDDSPACFVPRWANSWNGFRRWAKSGEFPEQGKIAYLGDGVFVDMSTERIHSHVALKTSLLVSLKQYATETGLGYAYGDGVLISHKAAQLSNIPDLSYVRKSTIRDGRLKRVLTEAKDDFIEFLGSPDLVVEIVSPSSVRKDTKLLRERYHLAEIPEYWLIDARHDAVRFQLLTWSAAGYRALNAKDDWQKSPVLDREVRIRRSVDELGTVDYQIDFRKPGHAA